MTFDTGGPYEDPPVNPKLGKNLRITAAANQGGRRYMEDRVQIETVRFPDGSIDYVFLGVYDGHGGAEASQFTKMHMLRNIRKQPEFESEDDDEFLVAIRKGFLRTHHEMQAVVADWPRTASGYPSTAGTTASVAFIRRGKVYTGHVGDSSIVLGRKVVQQTMERDEPSTAMSAIRLTVDHKPESVEEERRIREAGGEVVCKSGVMRVVWERPLRGHTGPVRRNTPTERIPFLAVARSLGDLWSWNEESQKFVVSPVPDLDVHILDESDVCLVLASDGLTNVLAPLLSTIIVDMCEKFTSEEREGDDQRLQRPFHKNHARMLLKHSLNAWRNLRADNISVIAAVFDGIGTQLFDNEPCVKERLSDDCSLDDVLTRHPDFMIRVAPERTQRLRTEYVPILYNGALDTNADTLDFTGPGFFSHAEELVRDKEHLEEMEMDEEDDEDEDEEEEEEREEKTRTPVPIRNPVSIAVPKKDTKVVPLEVTPDNKKNEIRPAPTRSTKRTHADENRAKKKHKYYCNEHGVECNKAKRANQQYEMQRNANGLPPTSAGSSQEKCMVVETEEEEEDTDAASDEEECPATSSTSSINLAPLMEAVATRRASVIRKSASPRRSTTSSTPVTNEDTSTRSTATTTDAVTTTPPSKEMIFSPRATRSSKRAHKATPPPSSSSNVQRGSSSKSSMVTSVADRPTRTPRRRINSLVASPAAVAVANQNTTNTVTPGRAARGDGIHFNIRVDRDSTEYGIVTRSRERAHSLSTTLTVSLRAGTPEQNGGLVDGFYTPASRLVLSSDRRSSRKRPLRDGHQQQQSGGSPTGVTPLVGRFSLQSPANQHTTTRECAKKEGAEKKGAVKKIEVLQEEDDVMDEEEQPTVTRSEPTTPVKSPAFVSRLPPSRWSLGRLDPSQSAGSSSSPTSSRPNGEPPAKRSKIWGFLRRLVGVGDSE